MEEPQPQSPFARPSARREPASINVSIYFPNAAEFDELKRIAQERGRGSASTIVAQLVTAFVRAAQEQSPTARIIRIADIEVFL